MNANTMMPKEYLSANDVHDSKGKSISLAATITGLRKVTVGTDNDERWALTFKGTDRKLTLNKTNLSVLIELYGAETDDWTDKSISLYGATTQYQGKNVKAIRVGEPVVGAPDLVAVEHFDPDDEIPV